MNRLRSFIKELLIIGLTAFVILSIIKFFENRRNEDITNNSFYSIGKIISYRHYKASKFQSQPAKLEYTYQYVSNTYKDTYTDHIPSGIEIGNFYFVVVNKKDPTKSIINLNYPIKDSSDFKRYVKEFEQRRRKKEE